jgi:hypothetical protein
MSTKAVKGRKATSSALQEARAISDPRPVTRDDQASPSTATRGPRKSDSKNPASKKSSSRESAPPLDPIEVAGDSTSAVNPAETSTQAAGNSNSFDPYANSFNSLTYEYNTRLIDHAAMPNNNSNIPVADNGLPFPSAPGQSSNNGTSVAHPSGYAAGCNAGAIAAPAFGNDLNSNAPPSLGDDPHMPTFLPAPGGWFVAPFPGALPVQYGLPPYAMAEARYHPILKIWQPAPWFHGIPGFGKSFPFNLLAICSIS